MFSPSAIDLANWITAYTGYFPIEVSWVNMKQSAPSRIAEVISSASVLLHYSFVIIDSTT
jgi:hypothetical protein